MTYRDEFDEPPRGNGSFLSRIGPKAAFFLVLIALSFMIGVVWKLYVGANNTNEQNVPIVRADDNPFKVVPDDPGGMEIPHKDSTIFSALKSDGDDERKIENLLADDDNEEPMPRSQLFAGLNTEQNPDLETSDESSPLDKSMGDVTQKIGQEMEGKTDAVGETVDETVEKAAEETEEVFKENIVTLTPKIEMPEAVAPEKVVPVVKAVEALKPASKTATAPAPVKVTPTPTATTSSVSGDYYVQVGSVKSAEGAESEWKKFVKKYSVLSGMSHRVEKADLGEKGTFYRIQAGPMSKDKATSTCNSIKAISSGGCLVKKK